MVGCWNNKNWKQRVKVDVMLDQIRKYHKWQRDEKTSNIRIQALSSYHAKMMLSNKNHDSPLTIPKHVSGIGIDQLQWEWCIFNSKDAIFFQRQNASKMGLKWVAPGWWMAGPFKWPTLTWNNAICGMRISHWRLNIFELCWTMLNYESMRNWRASSKYSKVIRQSGGDCRMQRHTFCGIKIPTDLGSGAVNRNQKRAIGSWLPWHAMATDLHSRHSQRLADGDWTPLPIEISRLNCPKRSLPCDSFATSKRTW